MSVVHKPRELYGDFVSNVYMAETIGGKVKSTPYFMHKSVSLVNKEIEINILIS